MKPRQRTEGSAQKVPAEGEPVLAKRPDPEEGIGEVNCNKENLLFQRL